MPVDYKKTGTVGRVMKSVEPQSMKFETADDFGFSTMEVETIKELPEVTGDMKESMVRAADAETKADQRTRDMYDAILPLLNNLLKDADENPYIHWPNRTSKIEAFKKKLEGIRNRED